ncbi:lactonase family protein [Fulvivirga sp. M361]|uniref:lactonase family protein n=1 Tax=Fulvivirga sp. M361 TaxID=2594266 RepID=UPI00117A5A1F|nr:lactonase family protein [Fulvivirga sp. M361]TRX50022.1 lactonase family protein [Fulvivirga sp. M361]
MKIYIGSYTQKLSEEIVGRGKGIQCYDIDERLQELRPLSTIFQRNPAYITRSENGRFLYAAEELFSDENPKIYAYKVDDQGGLTLINSREFRGSLACHLTVHNNCLLVANYGSGNVLVFPIDAFGAILPESHEVRHRGVGPNLSRQESPHAHMICVVRTDLIYVVDLGIDSCKAYALTASNGLKPVPEWDLNMDPGSGPRHMVAHPDKPLVFVFCELTGDIYTFNISADHPTLLHRVNSLPPSYNSTPSGAAIRIHPNGKFLYVSNRGCDTITLFELTSSGKLDLLAIEKIRDKTPRDFTIDPEGKVLVVAGMDSHTISMYGLNNNSGKMTYLKTVDSVFSPSCILIAD